MAKWLSKFWEKFKKLWGQWTLARRISFVGIVVVSIVAFIVLSTISTQSTQIAIFNTSIDDEQLAQRMAIALDAGEISYSRGVDGKFYTENLLMARQARALLVREDLLPGELDAWNFFTNMDRWTLTDFERDINLLQALTTNLEQHISALDDIDSAKVSLVLPDSQFFMEDQKPVTASVVLQPKPGSDISENRKKMEGVVKLIQFAVEGLLAENITIMDFRGRVLNDFEGLEDLDRLSLTAKMLRQKRALEAQYTASILHSLSNVFTASRVDIINFDIDLSFVEKSIETKEHFPIVMREDNPNTPYSELEVIPSVVRSMEDSSQNFEGTGFNPEGPPGQEGQTPPAYQDLTNLVGQYNADTKIKNFEINERKIIEKKSPYEIKQISVGIVIDGTWTMNYDEKGQAIIKVDGTRTREYEPVSDTVLLQARTLIEGAVGYSRARGDVIKVENIPFDHSERFRLEDKQWQNKRRIQLIILYSIFGLVGIVILIVMARIISFQIEKRRREREERLALQHQAMRDQALRNAEEEGGIEMEMSVEERTRIEMQENAKNMAREHPEDVAQLIRTWLVEE